MRPLTFGLSLVLLGWTAAGTAADVDLPGSARSKDKPEVNAVVWLDAPDAARAPQTARVVLDQRNLTFLPHVLAVRVGTTVDFPNNDRVFHNVFSFRDGKRFDLGMYPVATVKRVSFDRAGLSRIFCNIHPRMAAYVMAVDTPYFAVADSTGAFTIPQVPAGTYTYRAWRPGGPTLTGSVTTAPGTSLAVAWP